MVRLYEAARTDPYVASRLFLAARGITDPTIEQEAWALLEVEVHLRTIHRRGL
jgi:hypothetical protein